MTKFIEIGAKFEPDFKKYADDKQELAKKYLSLCMIGVTGVGKSATANSICGLLG